MHLHLVRKDESPVNKNKKKTPLIVPILSGICTIIWMYSLYINISAGAPQGLILLQCAAVIVFCTATIVHYIRYRRNKESE